MPRPTPVRDAVRSAIASNRKHAWSIEDLTAALVADGVTADTSSVFRALVALEAEGAVAKFDLGDGRAHFESVGDHHEHVRCERCGLVVPVPGCLLDDIENHVRRLTGFELSGHTVVLKGVCPRCQT